MTGVGVGIGMMIAGGVIFIISLVGIGRSYWAKGRPLPSEINNYHLHVHTELDKELN